MLTLPVPRVAWRRRIPVAMRIARVIVDIPTRALDAPFDYAVSAEFDDRVSVGVPVLVEFGHRMAVGYVTSTAEGDHEGLKPIVAVLGEPQFRPPAVASSEWIARTYLSPLSEALRLFTPPGGTPRAVKQPDGAWVLKPAAVAAVDDRWAELASGAVGFEPPARATMQRAVVEALSAGPLRVAELAADLGSVDAALKRLESLDVVRVERRRRIRDANVRERPAPRHRDLSAGQADALDAITSALEDRRGCLLLDGVTGSGKTEVYLRAIEQVLEAGGGSIVLVPEISLTPQTVGRFRTRFGEEVAVLHSRLSLGERFDQWDLLRTGAARVVVGARSALFAPIRDLRLVVIDEEHDSSYKHGSSPRYHTRDAAEVLCRESGAVLVLGSGTPSLESLARSRRGDLVRVELPERVAGGVLPEVLVVDMAAEFETGHRSMFSRPLIEALAEVRTKGSKAVLLLNRRGFASFLLCRECGFVPSCDSCSTSLTYHEVGSRLQCHHCGSVRAVPATCPSCNSPYLRQFGSGTQRVEAELTTLLPDVSVVRMDADTTTGKGGHERALARFEGLGSGILLGTQMIAKGLDYPEVTLVGVLNADTGLHLPDFRAGERTWQLLEQVAGRAGRGSLPGRVVIQTYWPEHRSVQAAAAHDASVFVEPELVEREELSYPPAARLANLIVRGRASAAVSAHVRELANRLRAGVPDGWFVLGPAPCPLARVKGVYRWHVLVKAPLESDLSSTIAAAIQGLHPPAEVAHAIDIDPVDLM
jgi:primosomal protein N' (replication factor Y)